MSARHILAKGILALSASFSSILHATELTVYTAIESDDLRKYAERFNQAHPDIKINWVRDSTGVITARLLAEKNNPRADVVWGLAATSLMLLQDEGMLLPYSPKGVEKLSPKFKDSAQPTHWVGMDAWMAAICFNTIEAKKHNLPMPTSWQDLTNPVYRGHIVMPNPASSGTGYLDVSSWLQLFGEQQGWAYMDKLHANIKNYTHSGSRPCVHAATGETAIGISFAFRGAREKQRGAPLELIFPTEGVGWDMEATAIIAGTKQQQAAQTLVDWSISQSAMEMYNEGYAIVAMPGIAKPVQYFPTNAESLLIDNNFQFAAANRERILREWERRYDAKSEAK
ncbi:putative 2-aminoethylphosphonate ABC transporter substrate-binding protein [Vibrio metschnikovii]|uniref:2-aminoethylphosphonate ABC transporter substrate-binding protein n=1 Tax=bacterium 19MO02SH05 TaxID=2920696 RepID=A0AAU6TFX6_UNCXX|nr:putative 2-aminoethylphosphonate ABC transporter substrate-binding protein [Vibrio metschnikovii]EKO3626486.1 putative 2-aminoethylphosphonate ABC transporter substrate-binding protein [Vibrio metschnikovii]EKO3639962.1 putative 2-aminoethylphosphonate ABC transporter substrate-binding protein [Vibrio metschnikovii]EKO3697614.1 putative 2-aminoethylphosphonate ABC transporter substrate-binding protein [Vibrio metschnikovii]EKO3720868.1 putative 2-aminoethylphosphonate ABC transporter substra